MNTDTDILTDLVQTLQDGRKGFSQAADKLGDDGHTNLASTFRELSQQRSQFASELRRLSGDEDTYEEEGSAVAALHRGWIRMKDALTGTDPEGVIDAAETGEEHAVKEYQKALDNDDLSGEARSVVQRQYTEIQAAQSRVAALKNATS